MSDLRPPSPNAAETLAPTPTTASPNATATETFMIGGSGDSSVRPFEFRASDEELADLRRRILATRWPDRETVDDDSQGVQLATMRKLADYWATRL